MQTRPSCGSAPSSHSGEPVPVTLVRLEPLGTVSPGLFRTCARLPPPNTVALGVEGAWNLEQPVSVSSTTVLAPNEKI